MKGTFNLAQQIGVSVLAMLLTTVPLGALGNKPCLLGPPELGISIVESNLMECLARLRRFDGPADELGRIYARYGDVPLAVDTTGSYRYYEDGDVWVPFAGVEGRAKASARDIETAALRAVTSAGRPELAAPRTAAEIPLTTHSNATNDALEVEVSHSGDPQAAELKRSMQLDQVDSEKTSDLAVTASTDVEAAAVQRDDVTVRPGTQAGSAADEEVVGAETSAQSDPVHICQYRTVGDWKTSREASLQGCAAQVRSVHFSNGGAGISNGYWRGTFIIVTSLGTYTSVDGKSNWTLVND